ncbi:Zinc finger protein 598 [Trichuris trichiura]|uniref:Zinc finger protein 598 n=1 Tax=Trichuris trichiura TaxID=36087 RepID=A0A077Z6U6_TRITR|nr:Zinc finger protein 598 [Trichuris trichiura]
MSVCIICCDSAKYFMHGSCCHPICLKCGLRIRFLGGSNECPVCRQEMRTCFVVNDAGTVPERATFVSEKRFEARGIEFETPALLRMANDLLAFRCSVCPEEENEFHDFSSLRAHMQRKHELFYCEICIENILRFPSEFVYYTRELLARHRRVGTADDKSQRGHPSCSFCDVRYLDDDQLYRNRQHLVNHFRNQHHLCEEGRCRDEPLGVAFDSEFDLRYHKAVEHSACSDRSRVRLSPAVGADPQYRRYGRQDDSWGYSFQSMERVPIVPNPVPAFTMETADFPTLDGRQGEATSSSSESRLPSWSKLSSNRYSLDDFPALGDSQQNDSAGTSAKTDSTRKSHPSKAEERTAAYTTKTKERMNVSDVKTSPAPSTSAASVNKPASRQVDVKGKVSLSLANIVSKNSVPSADDFPELPGAKAVNESNAADDAACWKQVQSKKKANGVPPAEGSIKTKPPVTQGSSSSAVVSKTQQKSLKSTVAKLTNGPTTFEEAFPALGSSSTITNAPVSSGRWISPVATGKPANKKGLSQQLSKEIFSTTDEDYPVLGQPVAVSSANEFGDDLGVSFSDVLKTTKKCEEPKPPDSDQPKVESRNNKVEPPPLNEIQFPPLSSQVGKKAKSWKSSEPSDRTVEELTRDSSPLVSDLVEEVPRSMIAPLHVNIVENVYWEGDDELANEVSLTKVRNKAAVSKNGKEIQAKNGRPDKQGKRKEEREGTTGNNAIEKEKKKNGPADAKGKKSPKAAPNIPNKNKSEAEKPKRKGATNKALKASRKLSQVGASDSDEEVHHGVDNASEKTYDKEFMNKQLKANCFRFFMLIKYPDVFEVCDIKECEVHVASSYREPSHFYLRRFFFFLHLQAELQEDELQQLCHFCLQFKENEITAGDFFSELLYLLGEKLFFGIFKKLLCLWNDIHQQRRLLKVYLEHCVSSVGLPDNVLGSVSDWVKGISLCSQCSQVISDEDYDEHLYGHLIEED